MTSMSLSLSSTNCYQSHQSCLDHDCWCRRGWCSTQNRVRNLAKRLLFDFRERWKQDNASQYLVGDVITRGRGIRQVGLHPLAAFASALDPRTKFLKAYSKEDRIKIWAGLHNKAMEHCLLPGGVVEFAQKHVIKNTIQDKGASDSLSRHAKITRNKNFFNMGQESEEDEDNEGTMGEEADAVTNIAMQIESEITKYKSWSALTFFEVDDDGTTEVHADPLLWWKEKQFQLPILSCLARKYLCIPATEAPSERIFSTASLLLSKFRNRMDPDLAGRMVFIKKNYEWYEEFLTKKASEE